MNIFKILSVVFIAAIIALSLVCHSFAEGIDFAQWNSVEEVFVIADKHIPSNSGLINAQLKVTYEDPYRMKMLFMLKHNPFSEEANPGVKFRLNDGDEISFNLNGESEYNEEKYYLDSFCQADPFSGFVWFEVTLGVKEGIPDEKTLTVIFCDPDHIPSNTYTVNLAENKLNDMGQENTDEEKTQAKTNKTKSETKTKTDKTKKTANQNIATSQAEESEAIIHVADNSNISHSPVKEKVLFISAAAIVMASLIFTGGMHFLKRKKHRGDES